MPTISRAKRAKARVKRSLSQTKRSLRQAAFEAQRNFSTVVMLLAQAGGEVQVPIETVQQVVRTLGQAQFAIDPWTDENGVNLGARIHLVVQEPAVADESATTLTSEQIAELKDRMIARSQATDLPAFEAGSVTQELSTKGVEVEEPAILGAGCDGGLMSELPEQP